MKKTYKNFDFTLEQLLAIKEKVDVPQDFETKIMRRHFVEKSQHKLSRNNFILVFFRNNRLAFASLLAAALVFSFFLNVPQNDPEIQAEINDIVVLSQDIDYYDTADSVLNQVSTNDDIDINDEDELNELDEYINLLSS